MGFNAHVHQLTVSLKRKVVIRSKHGLKMNVQERLWESGSARVLGYTVYKVFLNRVYGTLQLKYEYSVYHFLWISGIKYTWKYTWVYLDEFWVLWQIFFGYTGIPLPPSPGRPWRIYLHYFIKRQKFQLSLVLCNCRQARTTGKVRIALPGSCRRKDSGRRVVMMGVDIREGVILGINMRKGGSTEGC